MIEHFLAREQVQFRMHHVCIFLREEVEEVGEMKQAVRPGRKLLAPVNHFGCAFSLTYQSSWRIRNLI
jgi:hypothetical protein